MFGGSSKKEQQVNHKTNQPSNLNSGGINSLGAGSAVTGDINAETDIRIDGQLEGNINCKGKVIIGSKGKVIGQIQSQNAVVEGQIEGSIDVKELLHVKESAKINGEVRTSKLMVDSGAVMNIKCQMGNQSKMKAPENRVLEKTK